MADKAQSSTVSVAPCPSVILPPRSSVESLFVNPSSASPGPMTLVSSLFSENYPGSACQSFSQLLAGMASPAAAGGGRTLSVDNSNAKELGEVGGGEKSLGLKQHRSMGLMVAHSPMFMIPAGLSPGALFNSPGMFSPLQSPFGMSHQQALAQVTAQAALMQSHIRVQARQQPSLPAGFEQTSTEHHPFNGNMSIVENKKSSNSSIPVDQSDLLRSERRAQSSSTTVDKPTDDGYNWRKYGQKQVKGSEYPRSYYKCTHPNCPVKKKVERSFDGGLTEIIYKGQHNHDQFLANKRIKDVSDLNVTTVNSQTKPKLHIINQTGDFNQTNEILRVHTQATPVQSTLCSDTEEEGGVETVTENANNDDEPDPKRRNTGNGASVSASSQKRVTESKIIVQTRSEVDYLDDGYRWRKYGQKIVKGNPNPRSYYKCTKEGCNVRKHVERASSDPKAVVTTYEGKHNHDIPTARSCRHAASVYAPPQNPNTMAVGKQTIIRQADAVKKEEGHDSHVAAIQLKEEQVSL